MGKKLSINIYQDSTKHVDEFLEKWHQFGTVEQINEIEYQLIGPGDKSCNLKMGINEITISGDIPSVSFMLIDALSKACESDKIIEGEVLYKNQSATSDFQGVFNDTKNSHFKSPFGFNSIIKISGISKPKLIFLLILSIPLLIIILPIAIITIIVKLILFKLRFK